MYLPKSFALDDPTLITKILREYSFATLVTTGHSGLQASHLPFEYEPETNTLRTHLARANPQWRDFGNQEALAIFQGAHGYVSPRWYETDLAVPTWNYVAVHAYGIPRVMEDDAAVTRFLERLTATYEASFETPWRLEAPDDWQAKMRTAIVAVEIPISRLEAKAKLSQNRPEGDADRVIAGLQERGEAELAASMMKVRKIAFEG